MGSAIDDALKPHEEERAATVDLDAVVSGEWTEVVIACYGSTSSQLDEALGFEWEVKPSPDNPSFLALLAFSNGNDVLRYFSAGQDDDVVDHWYFNPCPIDANGQVIKLAREGAQVKFVFSGKAGDSFSYWTADPTEFADLELLTTP